MAESDGEPDAQAVRWPVEVVEERPIGHGRREGGHRVGAGQYVEHGRGVAHLNARSRPSVAAR